MKIAHTKGYINTDIRDLLSDDEIADADAQLKSIDDEFRKKTKLSKTDLVFLITAIALQAVRQYVIDPLIREHRTKATSDDEKAHGEKGSGWYRVPTDRILENTVPFDVGLYGENESVKDFLKGKKNHRDITLGHDPILGWVFGTANIMTGTVTNCTFNSAHVKYVPSKGNVIHSRADTTTIFSKVADRVANEGFDGKKALIYALIREGKHLWSDVKTKHSLPLPGVNVLCPEFGDKLLECGIDTASVGTEASISMLINLIISTIHRMIMPEHENEELYAVRTRKILLISNVIASTSNLIAVGIGSAIGAATDNPNLIKKSVKYLDVGGLLVTIGRLFADLRFIAKIKEEFMNTAIDSQLEGILDNLDQYL